MKSAREILGQMGLNPRAPEGPTRAFVHHLTREAERLSPRPAAEKSEPPAPRRETTGEQLSFDPDILKRR